MSIECGFCEHDLRGGHADDCPKKILDDLCGDEPSLIEAAISKIESLRDTLAEKERELTRAKEALRDAARIMWFPGLSKTWKERYKDVLEADDD